MPNETKPWQKCEKMFKRNVFKKSHVKFQLKYMIQRRFII
jgi:hypothetical protein